MTITYSYSVANATMCGFAKLLLRWKGSIYKLMYREMLIFISLYTFLSVLYRWCFNPAQKKIFEKIALYCHTYTDLIPLSFVFGFYVALVVARWWQQYNAIPWPDTLMLKVTSYVTGEDERGQMIRRTLMRYANLILVLTLQGTSIQVKKRFPTLDHLVEAGLMTKEDLRMLDSVPNIHGKWWFPSIWFCTLAVRARKENRIRDDYFLDRLIRDLDDFRGKCGLLFAYDWISVPLVYTQVATLAFYTFFLATLMGRQYLDPDQNYPGRDMDLYVPLFTILQFFFYMGWLKVAEQLINPFGEDDDDFEMNWIIDRNLQASYMATDCMHNKLPKLQKDMYWDDIEFDIPYTKSASKMKGEPFKGSTMNLDIPPEDMGFVPMETILEADTNEDDYDISSQDASPKSRHRLLANLDVLKKVDVFKDLEKIKMVADLMGASSGRPSAAHKRSSDSFSVTHLNAKSSRLPKNSADNSSLSRQLGSNANNGGNHHHAKPPKYRASLSATTGTGAANHRGKGDGSKSSFLGSSIKSLRSGSSMMLLSLFGNSAPPPPNTPKPRAGSGAPNSYNVFNAATNYHRSNPRRHRLSSSTQTASAMARHNSFNNHQDGQVEMHSQTPTAKLSVTSYQTQPPSMADFGGNREEQHKKLRDAMIEMEEAVEKAKSDALKQAKDTKITTAPINIPKLANTAAKAKVKPNNNGVVNPSGGGTLGRKPKKNDELEDVNVGAKGSSATERTEQNEKSKTMVGGRSRAGAAPQPAKGNSLFRGFIINNVKGDRPTGPPLLLQTNANSSSVGGGGLGAEGVGKEDSFSLADDDDDDDDMPIMNYDEEEEEEDDDEDEMMLMDEEIVSESVVSFGGVEENQARRYARHAMSPRGRKDKASLGDTETRKNTYNNTKSGRRGKHPVSTTRGGGDNDSDSAPDEGSQLVSSLSFEPAPLMLVGSCPPSYTYNPESGQLGRKAKISVDSRSQVRGTTKGEDGASPDSSHTDVDEYAQNQDTLTASSRYPCPKHTTVQTLLTSITTPSSPRATQGSPGLRRKYSCPAFAQPMPSSAPDDSRKSGFNRQFSPSPFPRMPAQSLPSTTLTLSDNKFKRRRSSFTTTTHSQTPTPTSVNRRSRMVHAVSHSFTPPSYHHLPLLDRPQYDFQDNRYIPAASVGVALPQYEVSTVVNSQNFKVAADEESLNDGLRRHSSPSRVVFRTGSKNEDALHGEEYVVVVPIEEGPEVTAGEEEDFEEKEQPELYVIQDSYKLLPTATASLDAKATQTEALSPHFDLDASTVVTHVTSSSTPSHEHHPFELGWRADDNLLNKFSTEREPLIRPPSPAITYTAANSATLKHEDASFVNFKPQFPSSSTSKTHRSFKKISEFFRPVHGGKRWPPTRKKMNSLSIITGRESSEERQAFLGKDSLSFLSRHSYGHASHHGHSGRRASNLSKSMSEPGTFTSIPSSTYQTLVGPPSVPIPLVLPQLGNTRLETPQALLEVEPGLKSDPNIAPTLLATCINAPFDKLSSTKHVVLEVIEEHCEIKCPSPQRISPVPTCAPNHPLDNAISVATTASIISDLKSSHDTRATSIEPGEFCGTVAGENGHSSLSHRDSLSKDSLDSSRASVDTIDSRSALIPAPPIHATTKVSIPYTS